MFDVAVLGAGPAGLAAAWWAARNGASVAVVERAPQSGGLAASFEVAGVRVDHGSHRLHPSTAPAILAELQTLLGDDLQTRPRRGRIRLEGRWIGFPLRTGDLLRHLPPSFALGAARDMITSPWRRDGGDGFPDVVRARLGETMWRRFYEPYAAKIWGVDPARLSGEQARRRISATSARDVVGSILRRSGPDTFFYPRRGFGQIVEALAAAATAGGASVRCGTAVMGLHTHGDSVTVACDTVDLQARQVWSTIPITALARLADPPAPPPVRDALMRLRFRAMLLVYLALPCSRWTPYDAHYLPEAITPITRVSEPKNYRDGDDPSDRTVICAEVPCDVDDALWSSDDRALAARVAGDLASLGLPRPETTEVVVRRVPHAYPIYERGWETAFSALDDWASQQPRLLSFGRQGLFAHDNTHHTLAMAWEAAHALTPQGVDRLRWTAARRRFAAHVVED